MMTHHTLAHITRISLVACLSFVLSVGMIPAGAFALNEAAAEPTQAIETPEPGTYEPGSLIVEYDADANLDKAVAASGVEAEGTENLFTGYGSTDIALVDVADGENLTEAANDLLADPRVKSVDFDYYLSASDSDDEAVASKSSSAPNDADFSEQWALADQEDNPYSIGQMPLWDEGTTGTDAVVAVIDSGADLTHEDLKNNFWHNPYTDFKVDVDGDAAGTKETMTKGSVGYDFVEGDETPDDSNRHGTHVSGIIAAEGNNGIGVSGVCQSAQLMELRILDGEGIGNFSSMYRAYNYVAAAKERGVNIVAVNCSLGNTKALSETSTIPVSCKRVIDTVGDLGVLSICAAGNERINYDSSSAFLEYPACTDSDYIITVASSSEDGTKSSSSCYGASQVDIAAPGNQIYSTVLKSGYGSISGTSMATPMVAGAVALLAASREDAGLENEAHVLRSMLLACSKPNTNFSGKVATGGILDLSAAHGGDEYYLGYEGIDGIDNASSLLAGYTSTSATEIPDPQKSGYVFRGWTVKGTDGTSYISTPKKSLVLAANSYKQDLELTAHWVAHYDITYSGGDGGVTGFDFDTSVSVRNPEKPVNHFAGWTVKGADGTNYISTPTKDLKLAANTYAQNLKLTAHWTPVAIGETFYSGSAKYKVTAAFGVAYVSYTGKSGVAATVPNTVTYMKRCYHVESIGPKAFNARGITSVTIGKYVKTIGSNAFNACSKLTRVNCNSGVLTKIDTRAFRYCTKLSFAVFMSTKLKSIGSYAFYNCPKLKTVKFKSSVISTASQAAFAKTYAAMNVCVPRAKQARYRALFTKAGLSKKAVMKTY